MRWSSAVASATIVLSVFARVDAAQARRIAIRTEDGVSLSGAYYEPSRRPAPGIILLPMLHRSHDDWDAAAQYLSDAGFAVVAIDFRPAGEDLTPLALDVKAARSEERRVGKECRSRW